MISSRPFSGFSHGRNFSDRGIVRGRDTAGDGGAAGKSGAVAAVNAGCRDGSAGLACRGAERAAFLFDGAWRAQRASRSAVCAPL